MGDETPSTEQGVSHRNRPALVRFCRADMLAIPGTLAGVFSVIIYSGPGQADMPPNPFSPEYGSILHTWLGMFAIALAALIGAAVPCRGARRVIVLGALLVLCGASMTPARHYLLYLLAAH
jgi:hypothetical protein